MLATTKDPLFQTKTESLRLWFAAIFFAAFFMNSGGCSPRLRPIVTFSGKTMGTVYNIKVVAPPRTFDRAVIEQEIIDLLDKINGLMSTYKQDSEVSRFNRFGKTEWFPISTQMARVISEAIRIGQLTEGSFDVTVGPIVNLWNFGPERKAEDRVPTQEEIDSTRERVGLLNLEVRNSPPALRKKRADLQIDLSGIAKGFAVDQIAEQLGTVGVMNYMVDVGGDMRAKGHNREGISWQIGIESPVLEARMIQRVIPLENRAMATSGDYRNYFEQDGIRYSHIINPSTGRPISHKLASVTVLAPTCMEADGLATALMVQGPDAGFDLAVREGLSCLFIIKNNAEFIEKTTPGFDDKLEK